MNFLRSDIAKIFSSYPDKIYPKIMFLRQLILETAKENKNIGEIEETLKWGEPSYITKEGSTIRIDWKKKIPNQYAMYFNCQTKLIPTFQIKYGELFKFEGNRAIIFGVNDDIHIKELAHCITLALTYHKIKNLPLLGI